jgi:hypothetical protein
MVLQLYWYDVVGLCGTGSILLGFFLLQAGKLHGQRIIFQAMNLFGALAVLVSLFGKFNVSVFVLESTWLVISGYGIWQSAKRKQRMAEQHRRPAGDS